MSHLPTSMNLKKSLGQHFLNDEQVCHRIVVALLEFPFRQLLEIGPGAGALTKYLVEIKGIHFKAVEIDHEKAMYLKTSYPGLAGQLIETDFLKMEMPFDGRFTVIGNFPYNISTQILFKILDWRQNVERVICMFQKEVAQRIAAREGNKTYGVISVLIQAFYQVEYLFDVDAHAFTPAPKVKSGVIRLTPLLVSLSAKTEKMFFLLVKTAFNQRRKMLRNAVKGLFSQEVLKESIFDRRAEQLSVREFADLTWKMQ